MADETVDDLANAALDGDERALEAARSDPDLQRLIDEHRQVRDAVRAEQFSVAPEQRRVHLEAALAVFDKLQPTTDSRTAPSATWTPSGTAAEHPVPKVASLGRQRRHKQRWLNLAAAAAVVSVGAIAAVSLTSIGFDPGGDSAGEASAEFTATTAQSSLDESDTTASPASASGEAPASEALDDSVEFATDDLDAADGDEQATGEATLALEEIPTTDSPAGAEATTVAPVDSARLDVAFPDGPLDPSFLACLPEFDVPDRPWITSVAISDESSSLELLVGDDFETIYRFVFDPATCVLLAPAEPLPDE